MVAKYRDGQYAFLMENPEAPTKFRVDLLLETLLGMVRERSLQGVFESCRAYFHQRPHAAALGIWLLEDDEQILSLKWSEFRTDSAPQTWDSGEDSYARVSVSDPLIGAAAKELQVVMCYGPKWNRPDWAEQEGIQSSLAFPMQFKGELVGVLGIFFYPAFDEGFNESARWLGILADYLAAAIANAQAYETIDLQTKRLEQENTYLREEVRRKALYDKIIGKSEVLLRILDQIEVAAPTDANILITGESGTGKELIARAIHDRSQRSNKSFVRVNCAAVPHGLFESEFFGHVRGAFTGAVKDRVGRFQVADSGTLMLDEVGEIPLELQGKLLRVLQEGEFERVGDVRTRKVSARIIAVTNRDLRQEADAGRFRQDLYYRLSVFPIRVPALRERREDIPLLARHFIKGAALRLGLPRPLVDEGVIKRLATLNWPGNIRELQNVMERAVISARGAELDFEMLQLGSFRKGSEEPPTSSIITEDEWKERQRINILNALELSNGKIQGDGSASELLGIKPNTLRSRMLALGITKPG
mgnify:CR=1 FL=1